MQDHQRCWWKQTTIKTTTMMQLRIWTRLIENCEGHYLFKNIAQIISQLILWSHFLFKRINNKVCQRERGGGEVEKEKKMPFHSIGLFSMWQKLWAIYVRVNLIKIMSVAIFHRRSSNDEVHCVLVNISWDNALEQLQLKYMSAVGAEWIRTQLRLGVHSVSTELCLISKLHIVNVSQ